MNASRKRRTMAAAMLSVAGLVAACQVAGPLPDEPIDLVEQGRQIFFNETFDGNGRTCGTCHRAADNFALSRRPSSRRCPWTTRCSSPRPTPTWRRISRTRC